MTVHWENRLLAWAYEARLVPAQLAPVHADSQALHDAYEYCEGITRRYSRTFFMASGLLPEDKRKAVRALYAFCRVSDNLVDDGGPFVLNREKQAALEAWKRCVNYPHLADAHTAPGYMQEQINLYQSVALAWADTQARYNIPAGYAQQLIDGVARDLSQTRYATFAELAEYAYGVASTVGLMAMYIIGFTGEDAISYAVKLGVALQLTNILRDVAEDWRAGRLYLPQDELAAFGLSEDDIAAKTVDGRWQAFLAFQIDRNRKLYAESWPGIPMLSADGRFAIAAAAELYCAILEDIEAHQGDVFSRRASISTWGKVRRLPTIWWRARSAGKVAARA